MPNKNWNKLSAMQLGKYAEYIAKMEFASYGMDVYTSEVDDHGIDFIVKDKNGRFCEIQVKSVNHSSYVFMQKTKFNITNENVYVVLLLFNDGRLPDVFVLPASLWRNPDSMFVDRNYDKEGQTSKPEYGISLAKKNISTLEKFRMEEMIVDFA
jgi:hypothetical protein